MRLVPPDNYAKIRADLEAARPENQKRTAFGLHGNFGRSVRLAANNELEELVNLRADEPLLLTVAFAADYRPNTVQGALSDRVRGRIRWGAGGIMHTVEIDVGAGAMATVLAETLLAEAGNEGTSAPVQVAASAGALPRPGPSRATRTRYIDAAIAAAGSSNVTVPDFANDITLQRVPNSASYRLQLYGRTNAGLVGTLRSEIRVAAAEEAPQHIPLGGDIRIVQILNDGVQIDAARAIFGLVI